MTPSLFTVDPHVLDNSDLSKEEVLRHWQHQVATLFDQLIRAALSWSAQATSGPISATGIASSLNDLGSPSGNSTIDTQQSFLIAVNLVWTTAANWTLTLNNVALGALLHLRLLNSSGATRTFTITARNPANASYAVTLWVPGASALSGPISLANGNGLNAHGVSFTVGGSPVIQLQGFGSTG